MYVITYGRKEGRILIMITQSFYYTLRYEAAASYPLQKEIAYNVAFH